MFQRGIMAGQKSKWKLVTEFPVVEYRCGARAGDRVRLRREITVRDCYGNPNGKVHIIGEIWHVVRGADEEPRVVWLREPDGSAHTWDDNEALWDSFERINDGSHPAVRQS